MSARTAPRRAVGTVALLSAVLLALTSLLLAPAASANRPTCKDVDGYGAVGNIEGNTAEAWGSAQFSQDDGPLILNVNDGYTVVLCLKKGTNPVETTAYVGPLEGVAVNYPDAPEGFSHYSWRLVDTEVGTDAPTFRDPTCDDPTVGVTLPTTTGVTYTLDDEDPQPGDTVTVTATADDGYVLEDGVDTSWEHTFGLVPDDCDVTEPVVVTPAVSFTDPTCDTPDGAAVDVTEIDGVSYTVTGDVEPGGSVEVTATVDEGVTLAEGAQLVWTHDFPALEDCDEPVTEVDAEEEERTPPATTDDPDEVEVLPNVVERPAPAPTATPTPAPAVAAQQLPATGLSSTGLLVLALLVLALGATTILGADPRREH